MITSPKRMLQTATRNGYAIGAFNVYNMETVQAVIDAAEMERAPVILQTSQNALSYAGMDVLGAMIHAAARSATVPIALHFDHGTNPALVYAAIESGWYTSVMIDGSRHPFQENMRVTKEVVRRAHAKRIWVEAKLGAIPGIEDHVNVANRDAFFTDPSLAKRFMKETGCDALAVAIGTKHGVSKFFKAPILDLDRLRAIRKVTRAPLVLHGASSLPASLIAIVERYGASLSDTHGISSGQIARAITVGIAKVNTDSDLRLAFTGAVDRCMTRHPNNVDPRLYLGAGREAVVKIVKQKIRLFRSNGNA